jgi:hemoglobin/transferrin/lactoferrin receptor protein
MRKFTGASALILAAGLYMASQSAAHASLQPQPLPQPQPQPQPQPHDDSPQDKAPDNKVENDQKSINDEAITVYATRNERSAHAFPGQVSVVDRELILDFNPSTLQDVFQAIPGTQFDNGPRRTGDAPTIRGLTGNGVLIFLDGARQSFASGHDGRFFVDPELVKSVEVVRGPSSALYGSGALGGVIATQTITARDFLGEDKNFGVRLNSGFQTVNDEFRIGVTGAAQSSDGTLDLVSHFTYRTAGNIRLGSGNVLPADDDITSALLKFTARPADGLELSASYLRFQLDATDPQNPQGANIAGPANELVFRDARNDTAQLGLKWDAASPLINLNVTGYYSRNAVEEDEVSSPRTVDRAVETYGILIDNRSRISLGGGNAITLTYGGEYYRDRQSGLDNETPDGSRGGVPDARTDFIGLFAQAELELDDLGPIPGQLSVIPGIRWDSFSSEADGEQFTIDDDQFSPKIGVSYRPVPQFLLFANYALGFRAPSFNEAFADGVHFAVPNLSVPPGPFGPSFVSNLFIGNADLQPEESQNWEIGAGFNFDDLLQDGDSFIIKGSYYRNNVDNLIGLDVNTPAGCFSPAFAFIQPCGTGPAFGNTSQNINIQDALIDGIEIEFSYDSHVFYVRGYFASIDGTDRGSGEFLEGVLQPDTFYMDFGAKLPGTGLRIGSRNTYATDFNEINRPQDARDAFLVSDVYAVWQPQFAGLKGVRLDLGIDNIADADFEVVNAGVSQPGRNFKIALSWTKDW